MILIMGLFNVEKQSKERFEPPTYDEGWDEIIIINETEWDIDFYKLQEVN